MIRTSEIHKAIFQRMKTLPYNVYDEIPENASNPHIEVGYSYEINRDLKNFDNKRYYQYIHVYSEYKGRKEVLEITDAIIDLLKNDIESENLIIAPRLIRNDVTKKSDNIGGSINGEHVHGTFRGAVLVYKFDVYEKNNNINNDDDKE